jgi:hydroxymethylpyrimidine pyrophosphatase-like HAD family hydrolase
MRYRALAVDYDGTLATDGIVASETVAALERWRASGRKVVLNTGRQIDDLRRVCPRLDVVDRVVAENGAIVFDPADGHIETCGTPPPVRFITTLRARGVSPLAVGRVIVATVQPHEPVVRETIRELGLPLQVILNKGALMILPAGIDKASGLATALAQLRVSSHETVAVGDAENDAAFLRMCGYSVAVANAWPALKATADWVTPSSSGPGVVEVIERLISEPD